MGGNSLMSATHVLSRSPAARLERSQRAWSLAFLSPLLLLLLFAFFLPIGIMLSKSVYDSAFAERPFAQAIISGCRP